ncbi:NADH oxidase [Halobacteriales archaeon QS_9_70_65]|nr:MAG: NADH oxidase [Halobacteriales archaeon QS_9_70_65]
MCASYVIIGDGIAGSSAAETLREADPDADVTVITEEGEALYNRILIKEFAKGKLPAAPVSIHDPDWYAERDIDLELDTVVTDVDTDAHEVRTHEGDVHGYDKLLIATGGTPTRLPVENGDAEGIHHFWTFENARAIKESASEAETGVVVGAGLLGIDLAAICGAQDVDAHYLMRGNAWWRYALSEEVTAAVDPDGERFEADFAGVAIGLNFNTEFIRDTDIETDNGILVDEHMQTNVEDIYAAGDITRFHDVILGERAQNGAWGSAKEQGSIAGQNMVADADADTDAEPAVFEWVSSYSITHFDFPFLSFGHPTIGDRTVERKYDDTTWRRVTIRDDRVVGGVLIGDLSAQSALKKLARRQVDVAGREELLLEDSIDVEAFQKEEERPATAE